MDLLDIKPKNLIDFVNCGDLTLFSSKTGLEDHDFQFELIFFDLPIFFRSGTQKVCGKASRNSDKRAAG